MCVVMKIQLRCIAFAICSSTLFLVMSLWAATTPAKSGKISLGVLNQIAALEQEKAARSLVEQKIDSNLLFARKMKLGLPIAKGIRTQRVLVDKDSAGLALVDVSAEVTDGLLAFLNQHGKVVNAFPQYHTVRARIGLEDLPGLAARNDVSFVRLAVRADYHRVDSQGDVTHQANLARQAFAVDGTGVKVGVISDSIDFLAKSQIAGLVTVLPKQDGMPQAGEGTAMLEIVNDLAPGAKLYFATAAGGPANLANNILQLRSAGCDVIVDDVQYLNESPFQDGLVAQAVDAVITDGALYFASAGNRFNKDSGASGTWEGDFSDGGAVGSERLHSFGGGFDYNPFIAGVAISLDLFWSDPLGQSSNDYDLFVIDASGSNVVASSTERQTGTQDPYEHIDRLLPGEAIVVVKAVGQQRFLHLDVHGGLLAFSTAGGVRGHCCSPGAFAVGAVNARRAYPNPFSAANVVEAFSCDGPRRVFYDLDGTPITPGNLSSSGGTLRQKPDIAAADGVISDFPAGDFNPFFGTSAAAPHAAAIAALVKSFNPNLTPPQIRTILTNTAIDIMAPGVDRDSGAGIVMALAALRSASTNVSSVIPTVQITLPKDQSVLSGQTTVRVLANDPTTSLVGVALYRFSPDATASTGMRLVASNSLAAAVTSTSFPWNTTSVGNGRYALFAVAYDAVGNQGYSQIINVTIQNTTQPPPTGGGPSFGNYVTDPLWQAANDMIDQWEIMLAVYLNEIAVRNAELIDAANQQTILFGQPVKAQLIEPDPRWLDYIDAQIEELLARQYQIQLKYLRR